MPTTQAQDEPPLPIEVDHESRDRDGDEPNQHRIEELRRQGLRSEDARRIERIERELNLPEEQTELDRVWAAALFRTDHKARREMIQRLILRVYNEEIMPYDALSRLHDLEIMDEELNYAKARENNWGEWELIFYEDGRAKKAIKYEPARQRIEINNVNMSYWHPDLPD